MNANKPNQLAAMQQGARQPSAKKRAVSSGASHGNGTLRAPKLAVKAKKQKTMKEEGGQHGSMAQQRPGKIAPPQTGKETEVSVKENTEQERKLPKKEEETSFQMKLSVQDSLVIDCLKKSAIHARDFCRRFRDCEIVQICLPCVRDVVLSEEGRDLNIEDRMYFSMQWDQDAVCLSPAKKFPAFASSARVAFGSKPILIRMNPFFPFTYKNKNLTIKVHKGEQQNQHNQLFSSIIDGEKIACIISSLASGETRAVYLPCKPTEYAKNGLIEIEITKKHFDTTYAEKKLNQMMDLHKEQLGDDISMVLNFIDRSQGETERDYLKHCFGGEPLQELLTDLLDAAVFLGNGECVERLLKLGALPSTVGVNMSTVKAATRPKIHYLISKGVSALKH